MHLTIGNKIFAIAASMTLVVAFAAMISVYFVGNVNNEVRRVAETYIPLSRVIESIEVHVLEQDILFERVVPRLQAGETGARIDPILDKFRNRADKVNEEFQTGLNLLRQAQEGEHFVDFKIELARLTALLQQVDGVHDDLQEQNATILEHLTQDGTAMLSALLPARLKRDLELERQLAVITDEVVALTQQAARNVAKAEYWALRINILATAVAALFSLIVSGMIARGLVRPIHSLVDAAQEIERGNLTPQLEVRSKDEIGNLTHAFQEMSAELRHKEQIKETFGKYVDPRVVDSLTKGEDAGLGDGERREYSVFFSDLVGFTGISEVLTPKALVALINAYLSEMSIPIRDGRGVIDKYIGDAIMAYWGPPFTAADDHAHAACSAALAQQSRLVEFRQRVGEITGLRRDAPHISMRIGIATGDVLVGSVGSEFSRNYTVIGDTVNLASRLEALGKQYGVSILVSEGTRQAVGDEFEFREIDTIAVVGKTETVDIFELVAGRDELTAEQSRLLTDFHSGLMQYRAGNWAEARISFADCLDQNTDDGPSRTLLNRIDGQETAPKNWDGVWRFKEK